ncbi:uncharacterized protein N7482_005866 [Penicillium canariense]|uniref:Uncharacterized protein n=1 Tax=Penicillium canariense TaxID=189055 RepID=A0A9W9I372_9EURO|nr:uncharacterized protein N7482_005866 [Penicillium canariense]KAJ5167085.1 hypothetical protein N7482_005866 [Penicillium canariense]
MLTTTLLPRSNSRGSNLELAYASPIVSPTFLREMGADMASLHRHNRKNSLPRALNDEAGKPSMDGRKRRSNGSSDDEGKMTDDGFSNEDLRVGGPYLCSIPHSSASLPQTNPLEALLRHEVSGREAIISCVYQILRNNNIDLMESGPWSHPVGLSLHQSEFNPEPEPIPTIVVFAIRHVVDDLWLKTARRIYFLLQQENFGHVSVDIMDPQALDPPRTHPVLKPDPMFNKWDSVLDHILRDIDLTDIQHIGCYRRGRNSGNENPVTVLVIADVNSQKSWQITRDMIAGILKRSNLPMVAVEIVKDRKTLTTDFHKEGFKEELLQGRAMAGGPIAHSRNDVGSGTLGGFIELQHPSTLKWTCFALTCFHVINLRDRDIRGQQHAAVEKWRSRGLSMLSTKDPLAETSLKTSHPSRRAIQEQIDKHQGLIDCHKNHWLYRDGLDLIDNGLFDTELTELRKQSWKRVHSDVMDLEKRINDIQGFFQNSDNILGHVSVASDFRRKKLHTLSDKYHLTLLDWALISVDVEKRSPSNELEDGLVLQEIASSETLSYLDTNELSTRLEFQGYGSGRNTVRYNGLKVAEIENKKYSLEYSIVELTENGHAAMKGDSGSLLCTLCLGEVVGMIIAGYSHNRIACFTRIDDLTKDIKEQSGAKDIRMWGTWSNCMASLVTDGRSF